MSMNCAVSKVAGVTFCNPDGESRQKILDNLGFGWKTAVLKQTVFEGERAVEVWIEGKQVGYIPKANLSCEFSYRDELKALVLYFPEQDINFVELYDTRDAELVIK